MLLDKNEDIVRVIRIVEIRGPRSAVEQQVQLSLHGTRPGVEGCIVTSVTLSEFPETIIPIAEEEATDNGA